MKKEIVENATDVKVTKKASRNVIKSLSVGLAAMMALSTPMATFAEDVEGNSDDGTNPAESTTPVSTQKSAAEQIQDIQNSEAAKNVENDIPAAKNAVNTAIEETTATGSGANQAMIEAAGDLNKAANATTEDGTIANQAEELVGKTTDDINNAKEAADQTDNAVDEAEKKADEVTEIAENANKEQQEAQTALDTETEKISGATTTEEAQTAYDNAANIVGDAQKTYEEAQTAYDSKLAEYNAAMEELEKAQAAYDQAIADANADVAAAETNLRTVKEKADTLAQAAEEAKQDIPELTDAQKAAIEIIDLENKRAQDPSVNWREEDVLFKTILKNYYVPEVLNGTLKDCKWTWFGDDSKNYCTVTYTTKDGEPVTTYLNYKLNQTRDDLVIFEKAEEVVVPEQYTVKDENGKKLFAVPASELDDNKELKEKGYTSREDENGNRYTIVKIQNQYYAVKDDSAVEPETNYQDSKYKKENEKISYSIDEEGKLIKTVTADITEISYTSATLDMTRSDTPYSWEATEKAMKEFSHSADVANANLYMGVTTTSKVSASYEQKFTTNIDLSNLAITISAIFGDRDKYEKEAVKKIRDELISRLKSEEAVQDLLGDGYSLVSFDYSANLVKDNELQSAEFEWYDKKDSTNTYKIMNSGTFTVVYTKTISAQEEVALDRNNADGSYGENKKLSNVRFAARDQAIANAKDSLNEMNADDFSLTNDIFNKINELIKDVDKNAELAVVTEEEKPFYVFGNKVGSVKVNKIKNFDNSRASGTSERNSDVTTHWDSDKTTFYYAGTYDMVEKENLGNQTIEKAKYNNVLNHEYAVTAYTSNAYYINYLNSNKTDTTGILLTGKNEENFKKFKDAALEAQSNNEKAEARADALVKAAANACEAVKKAQDDVNNLSKQLTALLASQNYTKDQVDLLQAQLSAAEAKLKEAKDTADGLSGKLTTAGVTLRDKITQLAPAPAGGTTTVTSPSETSAVATALVTGTPVEIAEAQVTLTPAAAPTVVRTARTVRTTVVNAANDDAEVTIDDEETPLVDNAEDNSKEDTTTISDEETPLAAEAGAMEDEMHQEKMSWWWLLIVAVFGVAGEEMYRRSRKKKTEAAEKIEK